MSRRKTFCEKYPELCERDIFTDYRPTKYVGNLGLPVSRPPPRRDITDVAPPPPRRDITDVAPPIRRKGVIELPEPNYRPRRNITDVPEPNYRPRRNITDVPRPRREKDNMGLPIKRRPLPSQEEEPPESALIALKELNDKFQQLKQKGKVGALQKIGLGTEKVIESLDQHKYGRLSDVAYKKGYNDTAGAEEIIANGDYIPDFVDFEILPELSTKDYTVLRNSTTGEVVMSFRGSDTKFADVKTIMENPERMTNIEDWWVNAHTMMGNPERTQRYKSSTKAVRSIANALGIEPSEIVFTGHSNGGGNARRQAEIFGAKAYTFNAADNPLKDMTNPEGAKEGTKVKAYRTIGDVVSAGHERLTPDHMEVERLSAKTGTETNLIEQHGVEQFYHDNPTIREGAVENVRTTKLRNVLGSATGIAGSLGKGALGVVGAEMFAPIYEDPEEEAKSQAFLAADTAKGLAFEGMLDPGGTLVDLVDTMGMGLLPEEKAYIRDLLGIKKSTEPPPKSKPPAIVAWLKKLTGRDKQDKELEEERAIYYGNVSGGGVKRDPETGELREVSQEEQDDAYARSQAFADSFNQGVGAPDLSQDINNADGSFIRDGKRYVEVP